MHRKMQHGKAIPGFKVIKMFTKKVAYNDYNKYSGSREMYLDQAWIIFNSLEWHEKTFFYIEINSVNTFQIIWKKNHFLLEITNDGDDMIYLQKYASYNECKDIITQIFNDTNFKSSVDFYAVPIMTKTLDDVINKKQ